MQRVTDRMFCAWMLRSCLEIEKEGLWFLNEIIHSVFCPCYLRFMLEAVTSVVKESEDRYTGGFIEVLWTQTLPKDWCRTGSFA